MERESGRMSPSSALRSVPFGAAAACALLMAWAAPAAPAAGLGRADDGSDSTGARGASSRPLASGGISMDEAVDMAQRRYNARVVRAEASEVDGRRVYVLRLLSADGRVWVVRVDAQSGAMQ
jgi:uncharacterized membrane protein YkoI